MEDLMSTSHVETIPLDAEALLFLTPGDPRRADLVRDPYGFYDRLRDHSPVYQAGDGRWLITGYDACSSILRDPRSSSATEVPEESQTLAHRIFLGSMLFNDEPEHARLRRTISALFAPRAIRALRDRVGEIARELLEPLRDTDSFDLMSGPAYKLPVLVIADMLGVPADDFDDFRAWTDVSRSLIERRSLLNDGCGLSDDAISKADAVALQALDYFSSIIEHRRSEPGDDVISRLVATAGQDTVLSVEEIVTMCVLLHMAGHNTTQGLVTNCIYAMSGSPSAYGVLRGDQSLIPGAIEEALRFIGPTNPIERMASADIEIAGNTIDKGSVILPMISAANRDPKMFANPHSFDVTRANNKHLAFGAGGHLCLGAHLARLEVGEFLRVLLTDFPDLVVSVDDAELSWLDSYVHRGLTALPVTWDRGTQKR
jgi:cytochrome P450